MTFDHTNTVFHYSIFRHKQDSRAKKSNVVTTNWPTFLELLKVFDDRTEKDGLNWTAGHYVDNHRNDDNVRLLSALVFDIDDMKTEDLEAALERIDVEAYAHSSFNDSAEKRKIRIVMPFKEPITFEDLSNTRDYVAAKYGIQYDPKTKNKSRIFYFPSGQYRWSRHFPGPLLEVYKPNPRLAPLLKPLRREKPDVQRLAENIVYGLPIAQRGARDDSMHKAAWMMIKNIPDLTEDEAVELIKPSLQKMETDSSFEDEVEKFRAKYQAADRHPELKVRANQPLISATPYTPEQLAQWAKEQNTTPEKLKKRWIIQRGRSYYLFKDGNYLPPQPFEMLAISLPEILAPTGLPITTTSPKGTPVLMQTSLMLQKYGTPAYYSIASLVAQNSSFDEKTSTFIEAVCPLAKINPTYHEDVGQWLKLLGGENESKLLDWLACVTLLDSQCAALFIEGDAGSGKTLLAGGIAKLWGSKKSPTPFSTLIGSFNDAIFNCPFVLADEGLPQATGANSINNELRKWTAPSGLSINRKYIAEASLHGNIRIMITANNDKALGAFDNMNKMDREALALRLIHINVNSGEARRLMNEKTLAEKKELLDVKLPEHLMWLRDTRKVVPGTRFLVEGEGTHIPNLLTVRQESVSAMYGVLVDVISSVKSDAVRQSHSDKLIYGEGKIYVTCGLFIDEDLWKKQCPGKLPPSRHVVNGILETISEEGVTKYGMHSFYNLKLDLIDVWAKTDNIHIWPDIRKLIEEKP